MAKNGKLNSRALKSGRCASAGKADTDTHRKSKHPEQPKGKNPNSHGQSAFKQYNDQLRQLQERQQAGAGKPGTGGKNKHGDQKSSAARPTAAPPAPAVPRAPPLTITLAPSMLLQLNPELALHSNGAAALADASGGNLNRAHNRYSVTDSLLVGEADDRKFEAEQRRLHVARIKAEIDVNNPFAILESSAGANTIPQIILAPATLRIPLMPSQASLTQEPQALVNYIKSSTLPHDETLPAFSGLSHGLTPLNVPVPELGGVSEDDL